MRWTLRVGLLTKLYQNQALLSYLILLLTASLYVYLLQVLCRKAEVAFRFVFIEISRGADLSRLCSNLRYMFEKGQEVVCSRRRNTIIGAQGPSPRQPSLVDWRTAETRNGQGMLTSTGVRQKASSNPVTTSCGRGKVKVQTNIVRFT